MATTTLVCRDSTELAARAGDLIARHAAEAIANRGRAMLALSGGSTPQPTYRLLPSVMRGSGVDGSRVSLFFCDERFVRADDPASNYGMVRDALGPESELRADLFPIRTGPGNAEQCAKAYQDLLGAKFGDPKSGPPRFDLIVLGLGEDGHTASLFPGAPSLSVQDRWVVATPPGTLPPPVERITMTFPVLNAAREILFLVSGANKARALGAALEGHANVMECPASGVAPHNGNVTWLVDQAAMPSD